MNRAFRYLGEHLKKIHYGEFPAARHSGVQQAPPPKKRRYAVHLALFLATFFTTTLTGAVPGGGIIDSMIGGLPYSCTLMAILLSHEMGHFFAAKRFGVRSTLPFFIPIYIPGMIQFGTMGAVIKMQSPVPDRRALLYIGAMGPICGFVVSVVAVVCGVYFSEVKPLPVPAGDMIIPVFGDSLLFKIIVTLIHGEIPRGHDIFLSPFAWAGWIGFLITGLNLMPLGQLDGGHVLYALTGRKQVYAGWFFLAILVILSFIWPGWIVWIALTLVILMVAHPPVRETGPLSTRDRIVGWFSMALLLLTYVPVPVTIMSQTP